MENKDNEIKELFATYYQGEEYSSTMSIIENKGNKILISCKAGALTYHVINNYMDILKYLNELDLLCLNYYGEKYENIIIDKFVDNKVVIKENGEYKLFCADKLMSILDKGIQKYCNDNKIKNIEFIAKMNKNTTSININFKNKQIVLYFDNDTLLAVERKDIPFSYFENIDFKRLGEIIDECNGKPIIFADNSKLNIKSTTKTLFEFTPIILVSSSNISIYDIFKDELWDGDINNFIK